MATVPAQRADRPFAVSAQHPSGLSGELVHRRQADRAICRCLLNMSTFTIDPTGIRLGIVDADSSRRQMLCTILHEIGYHTIIEPDTPSTIGRPTSDIVLVDLDDTPLPAPARLSAETGTPVIGVTSETTLDGRRRAVAAGITDFVTRPVEPNELRLRIDNALGTARLRRVLSDRSARLTEALRDHSAEVDTVRESLSVLAAVADFHDDDTDLHAHRVGALSGAIARALELPDHFAAMLAEAAPLHDIGKVGISRRILLKPGSLTPSERIHMMQHVDIGGQILAGAQSPVLVLAAEIARTHHERWDGSGYTDGLAAEQIPLSGRIVAVADVWDTLTHDRPYRAAWTPDKALHEVYDQAGAHFDPTVVEAFSSLEQEVLEPLGDGDVRVA